MNNEPLKKAFEESFKQKAPATFTQDLMQKMKSTEASHESLLPKSVLWTLGVMTALCILLVIVTAPNMNFTLPFQIANPSAFLQNIITLLILPLAVLSLLFIKNILDYLNLQKH